MGGPRANYWCRLSKRKGKESVYGASSEMSFIPSEGLSRKLPNSLAAPAQVHEITFVPLNHAFCATENQMESWRTAGIVPSRPLVKVSLK